ncbi:hypothetical protein [Streptomyces sp. WMMB303]|uniref:hypothetical protein n=1 Tax=Streptomyces sp. WMMB303 TaxID=3034154 RepID=UPI0023EAF59B|nr:hypothetical protein [Streptomyces sp. WMMB303]MDF4254670.1 hypothetical protein [Streptomyces sp. WMMB303]MDF4254707.1 hypothetical protein [Streptomyces sp. WMMB303]
MSDALTVRRVPEDWTPPEGWQRRPTDNGGEEVLGWLATVVYTLDLTTRELIASPVENPGPDGRDSEVLAQLGEHVYYSHILSGILPARIQLDHLPLDWWPQLATPAAINALLEQVEPLAREIADGALRVTGQPGTTLDWSPIAADAYGAASHLINRFPYRGGEHDFPRPRGAWYLDTAEVFRHRPDLIDPAWADYGDQDLSRVVSAIARSITDAADDDPELHETLVGLSRDSQCPPTPYDGRTPTLHPVGVRSWLHHYRRQQADGLEPVDVRWWDASGVHAHRIQDTTDDDELRQITARAVKEAAAQGIKLLGTDRWAEDLRRARRTDIREQLAAIGAEISETEAKLKPKKKQRRALLARVLTWDTEATDSGLGRISGLSHTAVRSMRDALNDDTDD